jgi:hypothetical protein
MYKLDKKNRVKINASKLKQLIGNEELFGCRIFRNTSLSRGDDIYCLMKDYGDKYDRQYGTTSSIWVMFNLTQGYMEYGVNSLGDMATVYEPKGIDVNNLGPVCSKNDKQAIKDLVELLEKLIDYNIVNRDSVTK